MIVVATHINKQKIEFGTNRLVYIEISLDKKSKS